MQIVDMVIDTTAAWLTQKMQTEIPTNDPTWVKEIRGGRLQDDPTAGIFIVFHPNDIEESGWRSEPTLAQSNHPFGIKGPRGMDPLPSFQIGGGETLWWRRFTMEIGCYFINRKYAREVAREHAHRVFGRAQYYVIGMGVDPSANLLGLTDEFGETVMGLILSSTRDTEGGGPPNEFIWRERTHFDVLTARVYP